MAESVMKLIIKGTIAAIVDEIDSNNVVLDAKMMALAAWHGRMDVATMLASRQCPVDEYTCNYAAIGGHYEFLVWARGRDWPISPMAYFADDMTILRWLHMTGCPIDNTAAIYAARNDRVAILRWLRQIGAPFDEDKIRESARQYERQNVIAFLDAK